MSRIKRSVSARKKRRKVLEQAKGYRAGKHSSYKRAKEQVQRSGQYAYRDRRVRKREFRKLWIVRINAGARENGLSYNQFMHGLQLAQVRARPQDPRRDRRERPAALRCSGRSGSRGSRSSLRRASRLGF